MERVQNNPSFSFAPEVSQICRGLFKRLSLNAFSFSRIYRDGSRVELWSDAYALEHSFFVKKHIARVYTPDLFNGQKFVFYSAAIENFPKEIRRRIENQLFDQKNLFDHDNCLFLIDYCPDFVEYCAFYTSSENHQAINAYLNHMDELIKFRRFFRFRAKKMIQQAEQSKLILPWRNIEENGGLDDEPTLADQKGVKKTTELMLTIREVEIANLLCEGRTAKESANFLSVTAKTVEKHIENIKNKTGIRKKFNWLII